MGVGMLIYSDRTYMFPYFNRVIEVRLGYGVYSDNNSLAVLLTCREADLDEELLDDEDYDYDYDESRFDEVLDAITINLESSVKLPANEQFIDIQNYPQLALWLLENDIAYPTGLDIKNGRILYPLYKFKVPPEFAEKLLNHPSE